jgi:hypothetical protein
MPSRFRALLATVALAALALPAAAVLLRITTYFQADFDLKAGPGQPLPLAAEKGTIIGSAPTFTVVSQPGGGGALLLTGGGTGSASATLLALFDKSFSGNELTIGWLMTPGVQCNSVTLRCMEDSDNEIIDAGWGGDGNGNGIVQVGGSGVAPLDYDQTYVCTLTLRDNLVGPDTWQFTMTNKAGGAPVTLAGLLALTHPLTVTQLQIVLGANSTGTSLLDDITATSPGMGSSK